MTGFGKATADLKDVIVTVEVRSLNSKQLDLFTRLPAMYREKEIDIRNELAGRMIRGKIELTVTLDFKEAEKALQLNAPVIRSYYRQLKDISAEVGGVNPESLISAVMRLPEVLNSSREQPDEEEWHLILQAVILSITELDKFRLQEGKALKDDILSRIISIEKLLLQINPFEKERMDSLKNRLSSNLSELFPNNSYDKNRLEQEMIYYLEKFDISEEKVRLQNHCTYFKTIANEEETVGKKLSFVAQEMGREINTIGSKANHSDIQRIVVLMKDELERIKEQLMNVL